jgi:NAD dependent epimerase/dehydratase family enzyme
MHRPSVIPVPEIALRLLFGEGATVITGGQHVIPEQALKLGYSFLFHALEPALRDLLLPRNQTQSPHSLAAAGGSP